MESKGKYAVYVDTGGTFSDAVIVDPSGEVTVGKATTIPDRLDISFFNTIEDAAQKIGMSLDELLANAVQVGYGTTAGTNMIVSEVAGPKLALITTKGIEDRSHIWRMRSAGLSKQQAMHVITAGGPRPLVPRSLIKGVKERVDVTGQVVIPLDEDEVKSVVAELAKQGVEGIAVCFLWSFLNNVHEVKVREIIKRVAPEMMVTISSEVAPVIREYPRLNSTIIDLYIGRALRELLERMTNRLTEHGYNQPLLVMQAIGGVAQAKVVHPATTLHSGPVGGLAGVEFLKTIYGFKNAMGSDVGGTSFDVTVSSQKGEEFIREPVVGRYEIANPMREIITIGAGGGTIARVDPITRTLRVGPDSAGGVPGPVCYETSGTEPTITDCDLVTNRIDPNYFLGGKRKLNRDIAMAAIKEKIADPLGIDVYQAAEGIIRVIDGSMQSTLKTTLASKGIDAADYVLFGFGGAGATHCAGYSKGLGFSKVIIPYYAAAFSAFGASTANIRHRYEASPYIRVPDIPFNPMTEKFITDELISLDQLPSDLPEKFNSALEQLEIRAYSELAEEGFSKDEVTLRYEMFARYGGQSWENRTVCPLSRIRTIHDVRAIIRAFEEEYLKVYGPIALSPKGGLEIITVAISAEAPSIKPVLKRHDYVGKDSSGAQKGIRSVYFGQWVETKIYEMSELQVGNVVNGPAIVEGWNTTLVVPEGRRVTRDEYLNFVMEES